MHLARKHEDLTSLNDEQHTLHSASKNGRLDILRSLLDQGSDVNERDISNATALEVTSRCGELEIAKLLIERSADVDSRDRDG